ncbi:MAG: CDP-glycerol glycerophosphotransferase family protein [Thiolinea sp.]
MNTALQSCVTKESRYQDVDNVVYFAGKTGNLYQLQQWLHPFQVLQQQLGRLLIVVRDAAVYSWVQDKTGFQVAYCKTMDSLQTLYENNDFKCILYVNNSALNFHSLMNNSALHVHINHGESEKTSTFSNRAKAYDRVFIVAQAALDKYMQNLINIDAGRFVRIGRPQLDFIEPVALPAAGKPVVLYAPTWEGTHYSMNYSSVPEHGLSIVKQLLAGGEYFLIYRPHPNTGSRCGQTRNADRQIRTLLAASPDAKVMDQCAINTVFSCVDVALFDNSAVAVDFLHFNKPMLMTDYFYRAERQDKPQITRACQMLSADSLQIVATPIKAALDNDPFATQRQAMRHYFLGDYAAGESTETFVKAIEDVIALRDQAISAQELTLSH